MNPVDRKERVSFRTTILNESPPVNPTNEKIVQLQVKSSQFEVKIGKEGIASVSCTLKRRYNAVVIHLMEPQDDPAAFDQLRKRVGKILGAFIYRYNQVEISFGYYDEVTLLDFKESIAKLSEEVLIGRQEKDAIIKWLQSRNEAVLRRSQAMLAKYRLFMNDFNLYVRDPFEAIYRNVNIHTGIADYLRSLIDEMDAAWGNPHKLGHQWITLLEYVKALEDNMDALEESDDRYIGKRMYLSGSLYGVNNFLGKHGALIHKILRSSKEAQEPWFASRYQRIRLWRFEKDLQ